MKPMRAIFRGIFAVAAGLATLHSGRSDAAIILWGTPTTLSADSDVSTTGTLLYAFNMGTTGVSPAAVNGVTFSSFGATSGQPSVTVGPVTLAASSGNLISVNSSLGSTNTPYSSLTTAYKVLLASGTSANNAGATLTLTLGGLTTGQIYQVQLWSSDATAFLSTNTNNPALNTKTILSAGTAATLDTNNTNLSGGMGQWVTGTFTADALPQTIGLAADAGNFPVINGVEVRIVPEPASAGLLALGAAFLAARRRREEVVRS